MKELEKNLRRLSEDDVEIIALRWARDNHHLTTRNVNCFIAGFEVARQWLISHFAELLQDEGLYYQNDYSWQRISDLGNAGVPLSPDHNREFVAAQEVGELLIEASRLMSKNKVL